LRAGLRRGLATTHSVVYSLLAILSANAVSDCIVLLFLIMTAESPVELPEAATTVGEPIIEVQDLFKSLVGRVVTNGVSFKVYRGDTLIHHGRQRLWQSTLLRQVIGSIKASLRLDQNLR